MRFSVVVRGLAVLGLVAWLLGVVVLKTSVAYDDLSSLSLKQIVVITRHGDRSPIYTKIGKAEACEESTERWDYWASTLPSSEALGSLNVLNPPTEEPADKKTWPYGQLTKQGSEQMRGNGIALRRQYIESNFKLLPDRLDGSLDMVLRATSKARTIQSAQYLLMGLYPPEKRANGTFPIKVRSPNRENMYPKGCDRERELIRNMGSKGDDGFEEKYDSIVREMCDVEGHIPWNALRDLFHCRVEYDLPLPPNFTITDMELLERFNSRRRSAWYSEPAILRLSIGRFLKDLISAISTAESEEIRSDRNPKFVLFSGHDTTILPLLAAFKTLDIERWPDYASMLVLEVYEDKTPGSKKPDVIRILLNNRVLVLPSCKTKYCPLPTFVASLIDLIPQDWEQECKVG